MPKEIQRLSALSVARMTKPGLYADGAGLYLRIGRPFHPALQIRNCSSLTIFVTIQNDPTVQQHPTIYRPVRPLNRRALANVRCQENRT